MSLPSLLVCYLTSATKRTTLCCPLCCFRHKAAPERPPATSAAFICMNGSCVISNKDFQHLQNAHGLNLGCSYLTCCSLKCHSLLLFFFFLKSVTGGNQRELARQKHAKKACEHGKGKRGDDGLSAAARKQRYG